MVLNTHPRRCQTVALPIAEQLLSGWSEHGLHQLYVPVKAHF